MKKRFIMFLVALLLLCGCAKNEESTNTESSTEPTGDGKTHLWVLTELSMPDHANLLAETLKEEFESIHEDVVIDLDVLPIDAEEREIYLDSLRVQILAGEGPDIYLFPTSNTINYMVGIYGHSTTVDLLFADVTQCMYNGLFYDISEFYDADADIQKDQLMQGVMDAGCIGDARYVLPMHYNMPVIYADTAKLKESGLDMDALESGILDMYQSAIDLGDELWACGVECIKARYSLFPNAIDYETDKVNLTVEELSDFLRLHQQVKTLVGNNYKHRNSLDVYTYVVTDFSHITFRYPMRVGTLNDLINYKMMANANEVDLTVIPVRGVDGTLTAEVTYYGAVSANCQNPELAYEYLSMFLSENAQWDLYRRLTKYGGGNPVGWNDDAGLFAPGWPVLARGAMETIWNRIRSQNFLSFVDVKNEPRQLLGIKITDEDISLFETEVDRAIFPVIELEQQFVQARNALNPTSDFEAIAEELIWDLQWHLAEG